MRSPSLEIQAWCLAFDRRLLGLLDHPTTHLPWKGLRGLVAKDLKCGTTNGLPTITDAEPSRRAFRHAVSYRESQWSCVNAPKTEINGHDQLEAGSLQLAMHSPLSRSTTQSYHRKKEFFNTPRSTRTSRGAILLFFSFHLSSRLIPYMS